MLNYSGRFAAFVITVVLYIRTYTDSVLELFCATRLLGVRRFTWCSHCLVVFRGSLTLLTWSSSAIVTTGYSIVPLKTTRRLKRQANRIPSDNLVSQKSLKTVSLQCRDLKARGQRLIYNRPNRNWNFPAIIFEWINTYCQRMRKADRVTSKQINAIMPLRQATYRRKLMRALSSAFGSLKKWNTISCFNKQVSASRKGFVL